MRILVADDEPEMTRVLEALLTREHFSVDVFPDGQDALHYGLAQNYDCLVLDIMMPKMDGIEVLRALRAENVATPVLLLTAKSQVEDRIAGLDSGADDFISKPFGMMELVARVRAVLRRTESREENSDYQLGALFVSPKRHVVKVDGEEVSLTNKEFELLCLLLEHQGMAMTRDAIMDGVWGQEFSRENRTLDVHVRTLRTKLGPAGHYIETVRGVGYKMGGEGA